MLIIVINLKEEDLIEASSSGNSSNNNFISKIYSKFSSDYNDKIKKESKYRNLELLKNNNNLMRDKKSGVIEFYSLNQKIKRK